MSLPDSPQTRFDVVREGLNDEVGRSDKSAWDALHEIELSYTAAIAQRDRYRKAHARLEEQVETWKAVLFNRDEELKALQSKYDALWQEQEHPFDKTEYDRLFEQQQRYERALRRIRDWDGFRHTGEVRDLAGGTLDG